MARFGVLAAVMALFAAFVLGHILQTPYRTAGVIRYQRGSASQDIGAPDERQHVNYVIGLRKGEGFRVLEPKDPELYEHYQAHQPPLYYLIAAGWSMVAGGDLQTAEGGLRLRFLSLLIGLATLAGVWFLAQWGTGSDEAANASAAACLLPMFVGLNGAVSNDPLLFCLMTWSLALLVKFLREGRGFLVLWAGVLAGGAFLTKTTGIALIPVFAVGAYQAWKAKDQPSAGKWLPAAGAVVIAAAIASPWWIRNMGVYGDPFAMRAFQQSFTNSAQASDLIAAFGPAAYWSQWVAWWTARSFVGAFGYMDIYLFDSLGPGKFNQLYLAILFVLAIQAAAGIAWLARKREEEDTRTRGFGPVLAALAVVVALLFVQFNRQYFQGQARYLYPALAAIAVTLGTGAEALMTRWRRGLGWAALAVFLGILNAAFLTQLGAAFALRVR